MHSNQMSTIIIGGGIIGLSTAYFLSLSRPVTSFSQIHIIDSSAELLASASGFAGGFLALDWFSPPEAELGALSFRLHRQLAEKHSGQRRWGYAGSHVYSLGVDDPGVKAKGKTANSADWLLEGTSRANVARTDSKHDDVQGSVTQGEPINPDGSPAVFTPQRGGSLETIAGPEECAQIEPRELCEFLLEECEKRNVKVHLSTKAVECLVDKDGQLNGLKIESQGAGSELECDTIVLAAGAWTPRVFKTLFPDSTIRVPIDPLAGHSIVVRSPRYKAPFIDPYKRKIGGDDNWLCYSIYAAPGKHWNFATEAYARLARNGQAEIWLGGLNDADLPLPELATDVKAMIDRQSVNTVRKTIVQLTGLAREASDLHQDDLETVREGLGFRPVSRRGRPIVSRIKDEDLGGLTTGPGGVFIASGHGPWGIALSLGTGFVVTEMIEGKVPSADVSHLDIR
ncbi:hypothetical protein PV10_07688 [Exophiala mesophila]|uniref:FAD dependent oxidoreductase domain-containing protein n=1 Tax=Exophiala mesophila TaxID=212818 RepID=A0A0D1Z8J8_EXOME|nr:uncharacterized protein PV10_07688 [Exophiala mesophila]KIV90379.1 hypothetical protein PV10_07688 [Exophiala mesophila]